MSLSALLPPPEGRGQTRSRVSFNVGVPWLDFTPSSLSGGGVVSLQNQDRELSGREGEMVSATPLRGWGDGDAHPRPGQHHCEKGLNGP